MARCLPRNVFAKHAKLSTDQLLLHFCNIVSKTGVYPYRFLGGQIQTQKRGFLRWWYRFTGSYLLWYTASQYVLLLNSIARGREPMLIAIQSAWVFGTSAASAALIHRALEKDALQSLQRQYLSLHRAYLETKPEFFDRWRRDVERFACTALFNGWISSAIGICAFFLAFPDYPQHMYGYMLAEGESVDRLSMKCALFTVYETFMMVPDWGNRFATIVQHNTMHTGLALGLQASSYNTYLADVQRSENFRGESVLRQRLDAALGLSTRVRQFYGRYNEACAGFHCVFTTFAMFICWSCLYSCIEFYADLNPFALLLFVANVLSTIAYILSHTNQATLEMRLREFLADWETGVRAGLSDAEEKAYYRRVLRSHPPAYYAYAGICRMEPSTVLVMLHHLTNHVIVFLKTFN